MGRKAKNTLGTTRAVVHDLQTFVEIQSLLKSNFADIPTRPEKLVDEWRWCCCPILNGVTFLLNKDLISSDFEEALNLYHVAFRNIWDIFTGRSGIQARLAGEYGEDKQGEPISSDEYYGSIFKDHNWENTVSLDWHEKKSDLFTEGLRTCDVYKWLVGNYQKFNITTTWIDISAIRTLYKALSPVDRSLFNEMFQIGKKNGGWTFEERLNAYGAIKGVPEAVLLVKNNLPYNHTFTYQLSRALGQVKYKADKQELKTKVRFPTLQAKIDLPEWSCELAVKNGRTARQLCDLIENQLTSCSEQYALVIQQYLKGLDLQVEGFNLNNQIVNNLVAKYDIVNNHISSRLLGKFLTRLMRVQEGKITPDQMVELLVSKDEAERKIGQTLSQNS